MDLQPGRQLGHYRIEGRIGAGGMGEVYQATDTRLDRTVAIKVLPMASTADAAQRRRFEQEAKLAAAFSHPNIATVHDFDEEDGVTFIAMEFVRGKSLRSLLRDGPLSVEYALDIAASIASGLARAHAAGVLHRDLKPENIVLTEEGIPKILDFGVSKVLQNPEGTDNKAVTEAPTATGPASMITRAGEVVGTLYYMSPEQVQGHLVDARTDVFSFGVVLYEMLAGSLPFSGDSSLDTAASILRDEPPALTKIRDDLPSDVQTILSRCLMKDPSKRYASGQELSDALTALQRDLRAQMHAGRSVLRTPAMLLTAVAILAVLGVGLSAAYRHYSRIAWARNEALPEIERLFTSGDRDGALRLMYTALEIIPDDPYLAQYFGSIAIPLTFVTDPPGATVYAKGYNHPERDWILLGETPLPDVPIGMPARLRIEKDGYATYEAAPAAINLHITLFPENEVPPGMVHVPAGTAEFAGAASIDLDSFWIDKYEVTNREYKQFIDDGGYDDDSLWAPGIDRSAFVDTTGRPGPAGWALGAYPAGEDDLPVGGVNWFEANAFATWAGKSLPTVYHWRLAAQQTIFSEILRWSNFDTSGPAAVGSSLGLGPNGTYDMAGNVREWCLNQTGSYRYILGGAWSDPDYLYRDTDAADPLDRSAINGFRCMRTEEPPSDASLRAIEYTEYDHHADTAVDDRVFDLLMQSFEYDDRALETVTETVDDSQEFWRHEVVSVRAAYGDERFRIHLFLPRDTKPPYQAVVYFPPSSAYFLKDSTNPSFPFAYFIPRTGRALVYPIYAGTYERTVELQGPNDRRDRVIKIGKDLRRTIDYLETRDDIDSDKLAYFGLSWGGTYGPTMTVVEPRFAASIYIAGGLVRWPDDWPPVDVPQNFAPRVTVPTLMINGRDDFSDPVETNIQPMFEMLGTPAEHKRLVLLDGGHVPGSVTEIIRESLAWLDTYLGPVDKGD